MKISRSILILCSLILSSTSAFAADPKEFLQQSYLALIQGIDEGYRRLGSPSTHSSKIMLQIMKESELTVDKLVKAKTGAGLMISRAAYPGYIKIKMSYKGNEIESKWTPPQE